jgi:hypothetical protein
VSNPCPAGGNVRYPTRTKAHGALAAAIHKYNRGETDRRELRVYECVWCGSWHLTSTPTRTGPSAGFGSGESRDDT